MDCSSFSSSSVNVRLREGAILCRDMSARPIDRLSMPEEAAQRCRASRTRSTLTFFIKIRARAFYLISEGGHFATGLWAIP